MYRKWYNIEQAWPVTLLDRMPYVCSFFNKHVPNSDVCSNALNAWLSHSFSVAGAYGYGSGSDAYCFSSSYRRRYGVIGNRQENAQLASFVLCIHTAQHTHCMRMPYCFHFNQNTINFKWIPKSIKSQPANRNDAERSNAVCNMNMYMCTMYICSKTLIGAP